MRRHGIAAQRRAFKARMAGQRIAREVELTINGCMWAARAHREARRGAVIIAGQDGEVLRVVCVGIDGYGLDTQETPFHVKPEILARVGVRWVQEDLADKNLGDAPSSAEGNNERDSRVPAAPILGPGTAPISETYPQFLKRTGRSSS